MTTSLKVLIAEDNALVAMDIEQALKQSGHATIGPFGTVVESLSELKNTHPDFAFLDVELLDGRSFKIADKLKEMEIPFIFVTARTDLIKEAGYSNDAVLVKPFKRRQICDCLDRLGD